MSATSCIFLSAAQRRSLRAGLGIYVFHKVAAAPAQTLDPFEFTSPAKLEERIVALKAAGLQPTNLDQTSPIPAGSFVLTFDDGYANLITHALPVLQRQQVRAITFLVAGKLGGHNDWDIAKGDVMQPLMSQADVRIWLGAGHQIGSHSLTHPNLRKISAAAARKEIVASRQKLEDTFGVPVEHFCYPYGSYNEAIRDWVAVAGYRTASTVKLGVHSQGGSPFELKRLPPRTAVEWLAKAVHRLRQRLQ
jgi:peptidoglycan/xylan/chitin deacetylase (PgdA/CDA1 family)